MADTKPILALSSVGLGLALLLVALRIQSDRFAFTGWETRNSDALTNGAFELSVPALATLKEAVPTEQIPIVALEALEVLPEKRFARTQTPALAAAQTETPRVCNPRWRELESGPSGRMVREIC